MSGDGTYERHPLSEKWGNMPEEDHAKLVEDVPAMADRRPLSEIVIVDALYPRTGMLRELVADYAECVDELPPIEVDQANRLIDGRHRLEAHRKEGRTEIAVTVTEVEDDGALLELAAAATRTVQDHSRGPKSGRL